MKPKYRWYDYRGQRLDDLPNDVIESRNAKRGEADENIVINSFTKKERLTWRLIRLKWIAAWIKRKGVRHEGSYFA